MIPNTTFRDYPAKLDSAGNKRSARPERTISLSRSAGSLAGIFLLLIAGLGMLVLPAGAYTTPDSIVVAGNVYVSGVTLDPSALFTGDKATVTFQVTNGNADQSTVVNHATFGDKEISLTSGSYDASANIGPLQTRPFVFSVVTNAKEGTYYPTFSLSFRDADSLYYRAPVTVDNTPLILTVQSKPDTFSQGKKDSVTVQIANPRKNDVKNVVLEVTGSGMTASPSKIYIGPLAAGTDTNRTFSITPTQESPVTLTVTYDNGDNHHDVSLELPVSFAVNKKQASPQMSNVQVKLVNGIYDVTGDVTNAGLENANGVSVAALSPATPQDPYKSYIIGALKPDDFGSFEVTFAATGASVPLQMSYKDVDGNIITSRQDIALNVADPAAATSGPSLLPIIGIVLFIALVGGYLYVKKRKTQ